MRFTSRDTVGKLEMFLEEMCEADTSIALVKLRPFQHQRRSRESDPRKGDDGLGNAVSPEGKQSIRRRKKSSVETSWCLFHKVKTRVCLHS